MKLFKNIFGNLIGTFVYLISLVSPRRSDKICFGGVDNAKYLYLLTDWKKLGIRVYWFSNDNEQVEKMQRLGYNAFLKTSIVGLYHLLTSKVYVITHGISDINKWTCGNVKIVNVFHGLPYKKIGFDDPKHKKSIWKYLLSPTTLKKYDMQLSTSPFVETIFKRSFKIKNDRYVESMLPRDLLLLMQREDLYAFLKQQEETRIIETIDLLNTFKHVYIYMPTFRDTGRDFISDANIDFDLLNATMRETESLFIFKLHRETKSQKLAEAKNYSNLSIIDSKIDVYPLLPYTTCLITDYSSIYFDYLLMDDKRIIFYPFDYEEYKAQDRDFNFDESYMKGEYARSFEQLLSLFKMGEKQIPHISQEENRLLFWNNHTNVEELVDAIIKIARE